MTRVYIADAKPEELAALRILLVDLHMEVAGEATDWVTTLAQAPVSRTDMLLIDWDYSPPRRQQLWMKSEGLARPRWSLSSSAIWTPVSKPRCPRVPMRLSVKVRCPSVWRNAYAPLPQAFVLDDATWLNEKLENRRINAVPSAGANWDSFFKESIRRIQ